MAKCRSFAYAKSVANLLGGETGADSFQSDYITNNFKVMLLGSAYTPNLDTHETAADLTNEVSGTGYTAGGIPITSPTIVYTPANSWGVSRANSTVYGVGEIYRPAAANGHVYRCIVVGTSAGAPPTFETIESKSFTDGSAQFVEFGRGVTVIDSADPSISGASVTGIRYGVVYRDSGTPSTSPLFWLLQFCDDTLTTPMDVMVSASTFTITLPALGYHNFSNPAANFAA